MSRKEQKSKREEYLKMKEEKKIWRGEDKKTMFFQAVGLSRRKSAVPQDSLRK